MKKIWIGMMILLLCVACQSSSSDEQFQDYYQIKEQLITQHDFDKDYPFCVRVVFNRIEDVYRYIEAMAYANENDQNMCPVLGIVDDSISHLKVHYVDKSKHYYKGVQLSGQTTQVQSVKLYISYYLDEDKTERVEKYIEVEP